MPTPTLAYLRVSTGKQADQGLSLEVQQDKINVITFCAITESSRSKWISAVGLRM